MPIPQPKVPDLFDYSPDRYKRGRDGGCQCPHRGRTFHRPDEGRFFDLITDLAADADRAEREFEGEF